MGIGANTNNFYYPKRVPLIGIKKIVSNNLNTLALMNDGTVYAIGGYNVYGELGVGHSSMVYFPVQIAGLAGVTDLITSG